MNRSHIKWIGVIAAVLLAVTIYAWNLVAAPRPATPTVSSTVTPPTATLESSPAQRPSPSMEPKITWSATSIEVILSPGDTTSRTVTFTSSLPLRNVHIKVTTDKDREGTNDLSLGPDRSAKEKEGDAGKEKPKSTSSVKPFLKIEPDRFANVPADRPQTVRLSFAIPANAALGTYAGIIALRSNVAESDKDNNENDNDGKTLSQLKVVVNVWHAYDDSRLGLRIRIPPGWGQPTIAGGNKSTDNCGDAVSEPSISSLSANDPLPVYDAMARVVNQDAGVRIDVRTLTIPNNGYVTLCDKDGQRFSVADEAAAAASSGFTTISGYNLLTDQPRLDFIDPETDPELAQPIYILQRYVLYSSARRVEVRVLAGISASELTAFNCVANTPRLACAEDYFYTSPAASSLRTAVNQAQAIVQVLGE